MSDTIKITIIFLGKDNYYPHIVKVEQKSRRKHLGIKDFVYVNPEVIEKNDWS